METKRMWWLTLLGYKWSFALMAWWIRYDTGVRAAVVKRSKKECGIWDHRVHQKGKK